MKLWTIFLLLLVAIAVGAGGGYWFGHRGTAVKSEEAPAEGAAAAAEKPVASVRVAPIQHTSKSRTVIAYGTVAAPPGEVRVLSVPFECRVTRILVVPSQSVSAGQALIEVEASTATQLAYEEAKNAATAADRDLQLVKQRYEQKLATNTDLYAAENGQRLAQGRLKSLEQSGAAGPRELKTDVAGVISKVDVQIGQVVPVGNPLVEVAGQKQIEVKLGVEPTVVKYLKQDQSVKLHGIDAGAAEEVEGTIRVIAQRVDPTTRLVEVAVKLSPDAGFILEEFVTGEITLPPVDGLFVPRDAAFPGDGGQYTLFTVKDAVATKHTVQIGIESEGMVQIIGDGLKEGDLVAVVGNFELDDAMKVAATEWTPEKPPATEPAETQPSATRSSETQPAGTQPDTQPAESAPPRTRPATTQSSQANTWSLYGALVHAGRNTFALNSKAEGRK